MPMVHAPGVGGRWLLRLPSPGAAIRLRANQLSYLTARRPAQVRPARLLYGPGVADILIVEDDELIASSLVRALGAIGHRGLVEGTVGGARSG